VSRTIAFAAGCLLSLNLFASAVDIRGSRSCSKWVEEKRMAYSKKEMNRIPVLITLSGRADTSGKDILKGTDNESIFLWLDMYCQANPDKNLDDAGPVLARELMQLKGIKP
jgi:hypothetical protein